MTRNVLFSFVGETPQVVTETLFCLLRDYGTLDGEVHLLTTINMEKNASGLINEWIERFNGEYDTKWKPCMDANFAWENKEGGVQVIPIEDINNKEANDKTIDAITRIIYYWTTQDDVQLYVSVAGGRKQLGSYMYQALSWFGQPDRTKLCHVIPKPELEGRRTPDGWIEGYFPKAGSGRTEHEKANNASHGQYVDFVEQPVIYLKQFLPNFFGVSKIIDFTQPYLDEEKKLAKFPFVEEVELGNYLTFDSMCHRYDFMRGLIKNSSDHVKVFLEPKEEDGKSKIIIISNKFRRSLSVESSSILFIFYFLYWINLENETENDILYNKEDFMDIQDEKGKFLVDKFDEVLSKVLNHKTFEKEDYDRIYNSIIEINKKTIDMFIGYDIDAPKYRKYTALLGKEVYKCYIERVEQAIEYISNNCKESPLKSSLIIELRQRKCQMENEKNNVETDILKKITKDVNSIISNLSTKLQKEFAPSGLKINIGKTQRKPRLKNPEDSKSSSRYLEVDDIKTLEVTIHSP